MAPVKRVVIAGWEGNRRSGIVLTVCHRLSGLSICGLSDLMKGDEHPPYIPVYTPVKNMASFTLTFT